MIYTLTFNPALDYIITPSTASIGNVIRTKDERISAGGKGINVSLVLNNLGTDTTALGFVAGFTGCELEKILKSKGMACDFIHLADGMTRINVKILSKEETEFNARGPKIDKRDIDALFEKLSFLKSGDILVLSGSIPPDIDKNIYLEISQLLSKRCVDIVLDAEGDLLKNTLPAKPFLVKPNQYELSAILRKTLNSISEIADGARMLQKMGARNVFVSMGALGGILQTEKGDTISFSAPKGVSLSTTGAGDSAVAGFLAGYLESKSLEEALIWGITAGSASAFSQELTTKETFSSLLSKADRGSLSYL